MQIRNGGRVEERKEENMKKMRSELFNDGSKPKNKELGGGNKSTYMDQNKGYNSRNNSPHNAKAQE